MEIPIADMRYFRSILPGKTVNDKNGSSSPQQNRSMPPGATILLHCFG